MTYTPSPEAQKLLQLIETVDPADTAKLDEIDARVYCFLLEREFSATEGDGKWVRFTDGHKTFNTSVSYTRSRDALKAIRPDGFYPSIIRNPSGRWYGDDSNGDYPTPALQTEELAELHAIIQAIDYARQVNK